MVRIAVFNTYKKPEKTVYWHIKENTGIRMSYYAYMPAAFARKLHRFTEKLSVTAWQNRINPKRWKPVKPDWQKSPIDGSFIRKWFQNFAKHYGVDRLHIKYFMGHSIGDIDVKYEDFEEIAWQEYAKIVDKFPIEP